MNKILLWASKDIKREGNLKRRPVVSWKNTIDVRRFTFNIKVNSLVSKEWQDL